MDSIPAQSEGSIRQSTSCMNDSTSTIRCLNRKYTLQYTQFKGLRENDSVPNIVRTYNVFYKGTLFGNFTLQKAKGEDWQIRSQLGIVDPSDGFEKMDIGIRIVWKVFTQVYNADISNRSASAAGKETV